MSCSRTQHGDPSFLVFFVFFFLGGGGKYVLLKDTTRRPELGSNPRPLDPESKVLTTRPPRPLCKENEYTMLYISFHELF